MQRTKYVQAKTSVLHYLQTCFLSEKGRDYTANKYRKTFMEVKPVVFWILLFFVLSAINNKPI